MCAFYLSNFHVSNFFMLQNECENRKQLIKAILRPLRIDRSVVVLTAQPAATPVGRCGISSPCWHTHGGSSKINLDRFKVLMNGDPTIVDGVCLQWVGDFLGSLSNAAKRGLRAICRNVRGKWEPTGSACSLQ